MNTKIRQKIRENILRKAKGKCLALCKEHNLLLWEGYTELEGLRQCKMALI